MSFTDEKSVNEKTSLIALPIRLVRWGSVQWYTEGAQLPWQLFVGTNRPSEKRRDFKGMFPFDGRPEGRAFWQDK